jgi:hypothetical protein
MWIYKTELQRLIEHRETITDNIYLAGDEEPETRKDLMIALESIDNLISKYFDGKVEKSGQSESASDNAVQPQVST